MDMLNGSYLEIGTYNGKPLYKNEKDLNDEYRVNIIDQNLSRIQHLIPDGYVGRKVNYIFWSNINRRCILLHSNNFLIV